MAVAFTLSEKAKKPRREATFQGGLMLLTAIAAFARATYQLFAQTVSTAQLMGEIGILALANLVCF